MAEKKSKRKRFASVLCAKHGNTSPKGHSHKELIVSIPETKAKRLNGGCPICKHE